MYGIQFSLFFQNDGPKKVQSLRILKIRQHTAPKVFQCPVIKSVLVLIKVTNIYNNKIIIITYNNNIKNNKNNKNNIQ